MEDVKQTFSVSLSPQWNTSREPPQSLTHWRKNYETVTKKMQASMAVFFVFFKVILTLIYE